MRKWEIQHRYQEQNQSPRFENVKGLHPYFE